MNFNPQQPGIRFMGLAFFIILLVTLFPYGSGNHPIAPDDGPHGFGWNWHPGNFFINILLFAPLGFGLSRVADKRGLSPRARTVLCIGVGLGLSAAVEGVQLNFPSRSPSFFDLASNTAGAWIGLILHQTKGSRILDFVSSLSSRMKILGRWPLALAVLLYFALVIGMVTNSRRLTSLASWDESHPLILGNEHTADRPWHGWMRSLAIGDHALPPEEVAQYFEAAETGEVDPGLPANAYIFSEQGALAGRSPHLPDLAWQGNGPNVDQGKGEDVAVPEGGILFSPEKWLESPGPATSLTRRLKHSGQFTLAAVIATLDSNQTGPARIASLSLDPYNRNFTIGQSDSDLIVRLRNGLTGDNGSRAELFVPGILATNEPRHLVVTYGEGIERVYIDGAQNPHTLDFRYAAMVSGILFRFDERDLFGYKIVFFLILLGPWAALGLWFINRS